MSKDQTKTAYGSPSLSILHIYSQYSDCIIIFLLVLRLRAGIDLRGQVDMSSICTTRGFCTYEDMGIRVVLVLFKKSSHFTFVPREVRVQVSHVLDSDSDFTDIPDSKRQQLFHTDSKLGDSFFCWNVDFVLFPAQLDSP